MCLILKFLGLICKCFYVYVTYLPRRFVLIVDVFSQASKASLLARGLPTKTKPPAFKR